MSVRRRPLPEPDLDDEVWWEALGEGRFIVPWCNSCESSWLRPTPTCPRCGSSDWSFRELDRTGRVYSWVTIHWALDPSFKEDVPYTVVVANLEGGARINARLLGGTAGLVADAPLSLTVFEEGDRRVPGVRLVADPQPS